MKTAKLASIDPLAIGTTIQVGGAIYTDADHLYLCMMPDEPFAGRPHRADCAAIPHLGGKAELAIDP